MRAFLCGATRLFSIVGTIRWWVLSDEVSSIPAFIEASVSASMHLSMLSPTPPSTGMGGALPRDLMQNFVPRVGHLTRTKFHVFFIGNIRSQFTYLPHLSMWGYTGGFDLPFQPQGRSIDY